MHQMAIHSYQDKLFNTLSGGEKQRVHIARALAQTPQVFLLDEPTNHLDIRHQIAIIDWVKHQSATVILALHDLNHAFACDRVAVMDKGALVAFGTPSEVLVPEVLSPVFKVAVRKASWPHGDHPILSFAKAEA
jgi:iron complex transport system ATP-binding protein